MSDKTFVGFGFGAIQAGLFVYEAFKSNNFKRLVVAEVLPEVVRAVRENNGSYVVNVATAHGIEQHQIDGIEILNPADISDREKLVSAVSEASEISTALPSVKFYTSGGESSVSNIVAKGLELKNRVVREPAIIYTAENNNHAAEIFEKSLTPLINKPEGDGVNYFQCLNTVIGKMSGVVVDKNQIREQNLATVCPKIDRCFLVEEFNRILISSIKWPEFRRGITVFEEKPDLLPFEEAKLYGHNATHALLGYMGALKGLTYMAEARQDKELTGLAREAFLEESGKALCGRHKGIDKLFTEEGYRDYADDLLERMFNPHLRDTIERVTRDPDRKLGWNDRLIGTMRLALSHGIKPYRYAMGAAAAVSIIKAGNDKSTADVLSNIWKGLDVSKDEKQRVLELVINAEKDL